MSITLGIYDFFAYLIPGLLYLFVFNELLRSVGWRFFDAYAWFQYIQTSNALFLIPILIPLLIGAYIIGHVLEPIAITFVGFFYRLRNSKRVVVNCIDILEQRYPDLTIRFEPDDWEILFTFIRQRNIEMARVIDKFQADSIMLRNIAFGSFTLSFIQIGVFISNQKLESLINSLIALLFCLLTMLRSIQFRTWFFTDIFEAALEYGTSLKEVASYNRNNRTTVRKKRQQEVRNKRKAK
ncbi:MAG: hypothetical protein CNIPEHKO_00667 [Anaerolineales bacterium]|nr:hypothetical protein [Anaerolineales bacterium]